MIFINWEEVVTSRRSIRKYSADPVEEETIKKVLEDARLAPSWKNLQCWKFILVKDEEKRQKLAQALPSPNPAQKGITQAPFTVVLCADPQASGDHEGKEYYLVDAGIVMQQLVLAATAYGLGTCWVALFEEEAIKETLNVPPDYRVVALTPLGHPAESKKPRPRKELPEIVYLNSWGEKF